MRVEEVVVSAAFRLAEVIVGKCLDHLPLHRQAARIARAGVAVAESTLAMLIELFEREYLISVLAECGGRSAASRTVGKDVQGREADFAHDSTCFFEVVVCLAGEARDDICCDRDIGDHSPRGRDQLAERPRRGLARHPPQCRFASGLQGQMKVRQEAFILP